jgi:hypothetical protein
MSPICRRARTALTGVGALGLFLLQPALAVEVNVHTPEIHVPTPQIHVPTPQVHITTPTVHTRTLDAGKGQHLQIEHKGDLKTGKGDTDLDKSQKDNSGTTDGRKTPAGNGAGSPGVNALTGGSPSGTGSPGVNALTSNGRSPPGRVLVGVPLLGLLPLLTNIGVGVDPAAAFGATPVFTQGPQQASSGSPLFGWPTGSAFNLNAPQCPLGAGGAQCIENGGDDASYTAELTALQNALAKAQQAQNQEQDLAAACAVDPSGAGCSSVPSPTQLQQNVTNAQYAYQDFYTDMSLLVWLLSEIASNTPGTDITAGESGPAQAAVAAAINACLANPSSCDAVIAQLCSVLAGMGIQAGFSEVFFGPPIFYLGGLYPAFIPLGPTSQPVAPGFNYENPGPPPQSLSGQYVADIVAEALALAGL